MTGTISIIGSVGVPAKYGGFETLVDNLVQYHFKKKLKSRLIVFCSSSAYSIKKDWYLSAELKYLKLNANGAQSILYDSISMFYAALLKSDAILVLGVSGAIAIPFIKIFSSCKVIINIDGIEWKREKWKGLAKIFLRISEKIAIKFSDVTISDNQGIANYVFMEYGKNPVVIPYGGDHALLGISEDSTGIDLSFPYALSICRIEPENNLEYILKAFNSIDDINLIIVGNWNHSEYGRALKNKYNLKRNIYLLDPIYKIEPLKKLRECAKFYIHGHSAGGTNPSLVEMMYFGIPIFAFNCDFNRFTTENKAFFFNDANDLLEKIKKLKSSMAIQCGIDMLDVAQRRYTWDLIGKQYFSLMHDVEA